MLCQKKRRMGKPIQDMGNIDYNLPDVKHEPDIQ